MSTTEFKKYLNEVIKTVFKNEDKFIEAFAEVIGGAENIEEFYMASERCRIVTTTHDGIRTTTTINTTAVLDWIEAV